MRRGWVPAAGLLAAVLLLAACAPPASPVSTAGPIVGQALLDRPVSNPTVGGSFNLGLALADPSQEPWRSLAYGAREEATRQGVELELPLARGANSAERQADQLRELVQRRVDLALVVGGDGPLLTAAVAEASAHGLPLAGLSSSVSVERLVFKVGTDWYAMGRLQAECLGAVIGGRGQVARLSGPSNGLAALAQAQSFRETLHQRFPRIELVAEQSALLDRTGASEVVGGWLTRWPELARARRRCRGTRHRRSRRPVRGEPARPDQGGGRAAFTVRRALAPRRWHPLRHRAAGGGRGPGRRPQRPGLPARRAVRAEHQEPPVARHTTVCTD